MLTYTQTNNRVWCCCRYEKTQNTRTFRR